MQIGTAASNQYPLPRSSDVVHIDWLRDLGVQTCAGMRVLDLGCGSGFIARLAKKDGALVSVGVDIEKPRDGIFEPNSWNFVQANLDREDWCGALPLSQFDIIMAFDIIEHLKSPVVFLEQLRQLLSPEGFIYLTTPNVQSLERMLKPTSWSGATDPQHRILFSRYSLGFLLEKAGFEVVQMKAPMRSLRWLPCWLQPAIGGQILVQAKRR